MMMHLRNNIRFTHLCPLSQKVSQQQPDCKHIKLGVRVNGQHCPTVSRLRNCYILMCKLSPRPGIWSTGRCFDSVHPMSSNRIVYSTTLDALNQNSFRCTKFPAVIISFDPFSSSSSRDLSENRLGRIPDAIESLPKLRKL